MAKPFVRVPVGSGCAQRVVALYEKQRDGIYRFLVGQHLDPAIAQELTQYVFVDLFVALERGTQINSEQAWLYTVAGRAAADYWRREGRRRGVEADSELGSANVPTRKPTPEAQTANHEELCRVVAAFRRLPYEQRFCIQLRMQGLRYREIAKILKVSTSTVAEWIASAQERLRR